MCIISVQTFCLMYTNLLTDRQTVTLKIVDMDLVQATIYFFWTEYTMFEDQLYHKYNVLISA
jgi:hypothetical protein